MAKYRKSARSSHRCSVPGCHNRNTRIISKSLGRAPLFICEECIGYIAEVNEEIAVGEDTPTTANELTEESLKAMKREELDGLLTERGLAPKDFANKGECVAALLGEAE